MGFLVLARRESNHPVAAAVFFQWAKECAYTSLAPPMRRHARISREQHRDLGKALQFLAGSTNAVKSLHFRQNVTRHNEGLRQFKVSWGVAEEKLIQYFQFETVNASWTFLGRTVARRVFITGCFTHSPRAALNRLAGATRLSTS